MSAIKGERLYVNMGASQARKRLKGVGFGVRKVESAGKNRAVIIHTATGQHLRDLEAIFVDEATTLESSDAADDESIESVRNLGAASGRWLRAVGVRTRGDLEQVGALFAFKQVKHRQI